MKDTWSRLNELVQNVLAIAIVGAYLYLLIMKGEAPAELGLFAGAVLLYYGFKAYKANTSGK